MQKQEAGSPVQDWGINAKSIVFHGAYHIRYRGPKKPAYSESNRFVPARLLERTIRLPAGQAGEPSSEAIFWLELLGIASETR